MSSDVAIRVKNLSKCYEIYDTPRDRLKQFVLPKVKRAIGLEPNNYYREFWALRDISLEVKRGEIVGIVGCNGSGKSTLLQMICQTLTPTSGTIETSGRIAALLELGSGFNPEFTGRENVYMNSTILGLCKEEIDERFEDILAFAEIGDFIEQPVKTFSSGMFVRLAFAVAINVTPNILIIDEALAVGDAKFQLKCYRKLEEIKASGTTILFVTHDTVTVKSFCTRAILLNGGHLLSDGIPKDVVMQYFNLLFPESEQTELSNHPNSISASATPIDAQSSEKPLVFRPSESDKNFGLGYARVDTIRIDGISSGSMVAGGDQLKVTVCYDWDVDKVYKLALERSVPENMIMGISLADNKGSYFFGCTTYDKNILIGIDSPLHEVEFSFTLPHLAEGKYFVNAAFALGTQESHVQLCWYDGLVELNVSAINKYVYGLLYNEYEAHMKG